MSQIDRLLAEHCPDGVKVMVLGEIGEFVRGRRFTKADMVDEGIPCIHYGEIYTEYGVSARTTVSYVREGLRDHLRYAQPGDVIVAGVGETVEDVGKAVAWLGKGEVAIHDDSFLFRSELDPTYVSYYFQTSTFHAQKEQHVSRAKVKRLSSSGLSRVTIPIPPPEVQREIVRILDKMTELRTGLLTELRNEVQARTRQYEHYRNRLLTFTERVRWGKLSDICTNLDSRRRPITKSAREPGPYPYYGASGIVDHVSQYIFDGDYLLVSEDGANLLARSTPIAFSMSGKTWVNNHAHVLEFDGYIPRRFAEIYLNSIDLAPYVSGAAQPKLSQAGLNKIPIPMPQLEDQEYIVSTLDNFGALANDLSLGLSAEIEGRRKQYKYYRDNLLTFEERVA